MRQKRNQQSSTRKKARPSLTYAQREELVEAAVAESFTVAPHERNYAALATKYKPLSRWQVWRRSTGRTVSRTEAATARRLLQHGQEEIVVDWIVSATQDGILEPGSDMRASILEAVERCTGRRPSNHWLRDFCKRWQDRLADAVYIPNDAGEEAQVPDCHGGESADDSGSVAYDESVANSQVMPLETGNSRDIPNEDREMYIGDGDSVLEAGVPPIRRTRRRAPRTILRKNVSYEVRCQVLEQDNERLRELIREKQMLTEKAEREYLSLKKESDRLRTLLGIRTRPEHA